MTDFLSAPKLPVNISDIAADAKERVQRLLNAKKSRHAEKGTDAELSDACRQMESLFIHHLFKKWRATIISPDLSAAAGLKKFIHQCWMRKWPLKYLPEAGSVYRKCCCTNSAAVLLRSRKQNPMRMNKIISKVSGYLSDKRFGGPYT